MRMCRSKICRDCGKEIDESKIWFWRRYDGEIETYCYKCGRGRIDGWNNFGLKIEYPWREK